MKFDDIFSEVGGFGKFQVVLMAIQMLARICLPCHFLLSNFMAAVPRHHCDVGGLDGEMSDAGALGNLTQEQRLLVSVPREQDGSLSSCEMFEKPQYEYLRSWNSSVDAPTRECVSGWVYDNSTFKTTLVTEWDLVCSRKGMNKAAATIFFIGVMFGAPLFGFLSDRFGRRPILMVAYVASLSFATGSAFSTSYVMFVILRFFTGMALSGISIITYALNVEWFSIEHRTFSGVILSLDWTLGSWVLVGIAYLVNEWRMLILAVTSPLILSLITWWWLPESARWLASNGRIDAAHHYITRCAKTNNRSACLASITPMTLMEAGDIKSGKKYTFLDLFRTPNMRMIATYSGIAWFGVAFTYYGISLNVTGFGLDPYLTQFTFASVEMPLKLGVYYALKHLGRRFCLTGSLLSTGLCLFINLLIPKAHWVYRTTVAILGKAASEASFTTIFLYTTELYPTVVRQNGLGYTSFVARLAVSTSPMVALLDGVWRPLPDAIYSGIAVACGLVALLLPETSTSQLPELIEDVEHPVRGQIEKSFSEELKCESGDEKDQLRNKNLQNI